MSLEKILALKNKAQLNDMATQIQNGSGGSASPKGVFATLATLQADATANTTDGKKSIYVVTADGKWYYWNGSTWMAGGIYQATGIADGSVSASNLDADLTKKINRKSVKNLYDGKVVPKYRTTSTGLTSTTSDNYTVSSFVPVQYGKYYTISGISSIRNSSYSSFVLGYSNNDVSSFVKSISTFTQNTVTVYIDDVNIHYIVFNVSSDTYGTYAQALDNCIQVEEGQVPTSYEPQYYADSAKKITDVAISALQQQTQQQMHLIQPAFINNMVQMDSVRDTSTSDVGVTYKKVGTYGVSYNLLGDSAKELKSNILYAQYNSENSGTKSIYVNVANYVNNTTAIGKLKATPFSIPSGMFDNDGTLTGVGTYYPKDDFVHPNIAYDSAGVAGYKYWMIASVLPADNDGLSTWEDEDLFVSNDAKTWLRVKSLYESAKTYTAPNLSLPPHSLVTNNARKHGFLPIPSAGDSIEISVPADNGKPALDRVTITLTELPFKHDPAILIDGGYVYVYLSYHLPYVDRPGGSSRFLVCVRTNDGINWETVRSDGSTLTLTETSSRTIFTKDEQGRYNYMYYAYNRGYSNPQVIKYGTGDYELVYGNNFSMRFKGVTPYNFDFSQSYPVQDVGSGNHPTLLLDGTNLYLLNNSKMYVSTDRGQTLTPYTNYPAWLGGMDGMAYKKTLCKGDSGKVILVEAQRLLMPNVVKADADTYKSTTRMHQLYIYEYTSVADLASKAQNGLVDGYIDVQITKVNYQKQTRTTKLYPYVSPTKTTAVVNYPLMRIKLADWTVDSGDTIFVYIVLNSRHGAEVRFGGLEII